MSRPPESASGVAIGAGPWRCGFARFVWFCFSFCSLAPLQIAFLPRADFVLFCFGFSFGPVKKSHFPAENPVSGVFFRALGALNFCYLRRASRAHPLLLQPPRVCAAPPPLAVRCVLFSLCDLESAARCDSLTVAILLFSVRSLSETLAPRPWLQGLSILCASGKDLAFDTPDPVAPISFPSAPRPLLVLWLLVSDPSLSSRWAPAARSRDLEFWFALSALGFLSTLRCISPSPE